MAQEQALLRTDLSQHMPLIASGKVREIYAVDESTLLFVTTDRLSAYDVVMKNGIPEKGALLTHLSAHWFAVLQARIPTLRTHFISLSLPAALLSLSSSSSAALSLPAAAAVVAQVRDRSMQVRRLRVFPIEAIVRGYITGSAWKEYGQRGTVHGMPVSGPGGRKLEESEAFERPIYTPSTKAEAGGKDENIHPDRAAEIIGVDYANRIQELSLQLYETARDYAMSRGIIIADTKFEFALDEATDEVVLVDEVLTPDSSRFWPASSYRVGQTPESFDKQFVRDWLTRTGLKGKEGVEMPEQVVRKTREKYIEAYERLVGRSWKVDS